MEITKIRKYEDLKNLTEIAKLFYAEELASYIPQNRAFNSVRVIADYEHNAVFLKTEPGFTNQEILILSNSGQELLKKRPDLFIKAYPVNDNDSLDDITLRVLDNYRKISDILTTSSLAKLEAAIFFSAIDGQIAYLRSHGGAHIKSSAEISVADLERVADYFFKYYMFEGKVMLSDLRYIYIELLNGYVFTSTSDSEADDEDDIWNLTEAFKACVLLENKSDCTREDIKRYILTAARAAMGWYLE